MLSLIAIGALLSLVFFYYSSKWSAAYYDGRLKTYREELGIAYSGAEDAAYKVGCQLERKDSIIGKQEETLCMLRKRVDNLFTTNKEQAKEIQLHLLSITERDKLHDAFVNKTEKDISFITGLLDNEGRELLKEYEIDSLVTVSTLDICVIIHQRNEMDKMLDILSKYGEIGTYGNKTISMKAKHSQLVTLAAITGVNYITSNDGKLLAGI